MRSRPKLEKIWIIRWTGPILWPDGITCNMCAKRGSREEVEAFAREKAEENGLEVEAIV